MKRSGLPFCMTVASIDPFYWPPLQKSWLTSQIKIARPDIFYTEYSPFRLTYALRRKENSDQSNGNSEVSFMNLYRILGYDCFHKAIRLFR